MGTAIDRKLLTVYLSDHLAGATGAVTRLERMARSYKDASWRPQLAELADQVSRDRERLVAIIDQLGLRPRRHLLALGRAGEVGGRLKTNGRLVSASPLAPLVEVEAMRSGITGKRALWQSLQAHVDELGLSAEELADLEARARAQQELVEEVHSLVARGAFGG